MFFSMGFFWIKVKGRQATQKEAPVLAVAPHSGFLDMLVLSLVGLPTVVSRSENTNLPVIGGERCTKHGESLDDDDDDDMENNVVLPFSLSTFGV